MILKTILYIHVQLLYTICTKSKFAQPTIHSNQITVLIRLMLMALIFETIRHFSPIFSIYQ